MLQAPELASGTRLRARTEGSLPWRPGDAVRVQVTGPVVVLAGRPTALNEEVREPAAEPA